MNEKIVYIIIIFILCCCMFSCDKEVTNGGTINNNIIEENTNKIVLYVMPFYDSSYRALYVYLYNYYNEKYTYDVWCDNGYIIHSETNILCKSLNDVKNVFNFGWKPVNDELENNEKFEEAYLTLVQKEFENIVGYVIIKLTKIGIDGNNYSSNIIKSVSFPKINNTYQTILDSYIEMELQKYRLNKN